MQALTSTVQSVVDAHPAEPIGARELIEVVVRAHPEFAGGRASAVAIPWPPSPGAIAPATEYLQWVRDIYVPDAFGGQLHGKAAVLGAALVDRAVGRQMCAVGLFQALVEDLDEDDFEAVLSPDGRARYRSIPLAHVHREVPGGPGHSPGISVAAQSRDGRWIVVGDGARLTLYRGSDPVLDAPLPEPIAGLAVDATGRSILVGLDTMWGTYSVADKRFVRATVGPTTGSNDVDPTLQSSIIEAYSSAGDGSVLVATTPGSADIRVLSHDGAVRSYHLSEGVGPLAVSPTGRFVAQRGFEGTITVLDTRTSEMRVEQGDGLLVAVDDTGRLGAADSITIPGDASSALSIRVGDKATTHGIAHGAALAFSPDARFIAGVDSRGITLLETRELGEVTTIPIDEQRIDALSFSGDGHWLLATSAGSFVGQWEVGLTPAPQPPAPLAYSADAASGRGEDLIGIDPAVDAFASLIANRDLEPPLGIGIFGEWGSGKTFFMRRLRSRIEQLSTTARDSGQMQRDVSFAKRIVQVEFNAWHYSGGNLWAALVQHIFENLSLFGGEPEDEVLKRQRHILGQMRDLDAAREQLLSTHETVREEADTTETALDDLTTEHEERLAELKRLRVDDVITTLDKDDKIRTAIHALTHSLGLGAAKDSGAELVAGLQESRALLRRASPFFAVGKGPGFWHKPLALVGATLAGPIGAAAGEVVNKVAGSNLDGVAATIGGTAGLLSVGAQWLSKQNAWIETKIAEAEMLDTRLTERVRTAEAEYASERVVLEKRLDSIAARLASVQAEMARTDAAKAALDQRLGDVTPATVLAEYIMERAASDDYRKHLGLHARIKDDFDRIANIMDADRRSVRAATTLEMENEHASRRIDRIVLYIDDLDRCDADKVVEVLRAIHLLLAFPLFVAVVGIDVRWGARALQKVFPELLGGDGREAAAATPEDYLEKIFQIPYWLPPLDEGTAAGFVAGVIGDTIAVTAADAAAPDADADALDSASAPPSDPLPTQTTFSPSTAPPAPRPELNPVSLQIGPAERAFLADVAELLGSSPRAVKRFVNLYHVAKELASDPIDFVTERPGYGAPFQAVMILLAVDTGSPEEARALFTSLHDWVPDNDGPASLGAATNSIAQRDDAGTRKSASKLLAWAVSDPRRSNLHMQLIRSWIPSIGRFSFRSTESNVHVD